MKFHLKSFQILPKSNDGWQSPEYIFGACTTLVLGPNGAGKSPIVNALIGALGASVTLPPQIMEHCRSARLCLATDREEVCIEYIMGSSPAWTITQPDGAEERVSDEIRLSEILHPLLGIKSRPLRNKQKEYVIPYMSVILPAVAVNQDIGWAGIYQPPTNRKLIFDDQREEVFRILLGVPPRHTKDDSEKYRDAQQEAKRLDAQVQMKRAIIDGLLREEPSANSLNSVEVCLEQKRQIEQELHSLRAVWITNRAPEDLFDRAIISAKAQVENIQQRLNKTTEQLLLLSGNVEQIEEELRALEQNEVAADGFRLLCGSNSCSFFRQTDLSFGRRVLFLRDQLKDLTTTQGAFSRRILRFKDDLTNALAELSAAETAKTSLTAGDENLALTQRLETLTREYSQICVRLDRCRYISREREQLDTLINKRELAKENVAALKPSTAAAKITPRTGILRQALTEHFFEWAQILETPNLSQNIVYDSEFSLLIDNKKFTENAPIQGSSRTRVVLAHHAAMMQVAFEHNGEHPGFLIFDSPKQQEIEPRHLRAYLQRFLQVMQKLAPGSQLVLSSTDPDIAPDGIIDRTWSPTFSPLNVPRFLG